MLVLLFNHKGMSDSVKPWTATRQTSLSFTISRSFLKLMSIELVMPFNYLILCHPLLLLLSIFPSIRVFSNEMALHIRWTKYWRFSFSISPSNEYSGLISFRIGWFDLLTIQGTLRSLLQHHSSKASILQCSTSFMVQLSYSYMTTGKALALTIRNFVGNVMSLLFNMLSRFVIVFFPGANLSIDPRIFQKYTCINMRYKKSTSLCPAQHPTLGEALLLSIPQHMK